MASLAPGEAARALLPPHSHPRARPHMTRPASTCTLRGPPKLLLIPKSRSSIPRGGPGACHGRGQGHARAALHPRGQDSPRAALHPRAVLFPALGPRRPVFLSSVGFPPSHIACRVDFCFRPAFRLPRPPPPPLGAPRPGASERRGWRAPEGTIWTPAPWTDHAAWCGVLRMGRPRSSPRGPRRRHTRLRSFRGPVGGAVPRARPRTRRALASILGV